MSAHTHIAPPRGIRPARFWIDPSQSSAEHLSLNGTWQFQLFPTAETGTDPRADGADWDQITVPSMWQLAQYQPGSAQERGDQFPYGKPAYTNIQYPIPLDPPHVPNNNPTGEYRRSFTVPENWHDSGRVLIRFEGVDSFAQVWLNGVELAHIHGSRLPSEIDITDHLQAGENLLAVRVNQWSAFTYIEDQDQWWMSGIFRDVTLLHRPLDGAEHVQLITDYDHETGHGTIQVNVTDFSGASIRADVALPELGLEFASGQTVTALVEPWSAEVPQLYEVKIRTAGEQLTMRAGFKRIAIIDGVFTVNGAAIKLRGVNRHEFEPTRGRAITRETDVLDVELMKSHHINAVRTAHYPPHPAFLDVCDEQGLYVIDENDLETHGFEYLEGATTRWDRNPTDDPAWTDVLVDRVQRLVHRDGHHASIILWSLGNESGSGRNVKAMADAVRAIDPRTPIHYEGDWSSQYTDIYSRMYAFTPEVAQIGTRTEAPLADATLDARRRGMPFLQCEYAHAMGNGPGGLSDYDELFDAHPRNMGGFVWEWFDHGVLATSADGQEFYGYGGCFDEEIHDGTFIADGLLFPDRTPSPGLLELAAVYAPIRIDPIDVDGENALLLRNRYAFLDTSHVQLRWRIQAGGKVYGQGQISDPGLAPGQEQLLGPDEQMLQIAELAHESDASNDVWWQVEAVSKADPDFVLGAGQLQIAQRELFEPANSAVVVADDAAPTGVQTSPEGSFQVGPATFTATGELASLGGIAVSTARVDAWRAPTDNDHAQEWDTPSSMETLWRNARLHLLTERIDAVRADESGLVIEARCSGPATRNGFRARYHWRSSAPNSVDLTLDITPEGAWNCPLPRLGYLLGLEQDNASDVVVDWVGQGPGEAYADSHKAALAGGWRHTVAQLQTNYTHPQENGVRRGVTSAALQLSPATLSIIAGRVQVGGQAIDAIDFSARPWSDQILEQAKHPHELHPDGKLWLHLDAANHGLGTATCGPGVLANASLNPVPVQLNLRFTVG